MVFFTSILIISVLYFLQSDGLIYAIVIALAAELINIFLTHAVAKSVEKKYKSKLKTATIGYKKQLLTVKKRLEEFEKIRDDAGKKLYKADTRIKELEQQLNQVPPGAAPPKTPRPDLPPPSPQQPPNNKKNGPAGPDHKSGTKKTAEKPAPSRKKDSQDFHLPDGSNRKRFIP